MKKPLFLIFSIVFCIALPAQPYTSKDFKDVKVKTCNASVCDSKSEGQYAPAQRPAHYAPQNNDYLTHIGETHYILQTNANARNTVNWSPDGKSCAATWTIGGEPSGNPLSGVRGTAINYFDVHESSGYPSYYSWGSNPNMNPIERVETGPMNKNWAPGWGSHVFTETGECVISHCTAEGGMVINYRENRGEGEWIQYILKGPELSNGKTDILWPTTFAVGNTIHLVCVTSSTVGVTYNDYYMCPLYYRSTDGGQSWEEVRTFEGVMTDLDMREIGSDQYVLAARGNHVVLAYINGYAAYLESLDGGDTWERHLVYDTDWSWKSTGVWVGPTMYATTIASAIGDDEKVHIAFSAQMRHREPDDAPDSLTYYPTLCGLYTWNNAQPIMTHEGLNLEYDYDTQTWISLGYDLVPNFMNAPELIGLDTFYFWEPFEYEMLPDNNNRCGYISHPRLLAEGNRVYLLYSSIIEQPMLDPATTNKFLRGVFLTVSDDNGATYDQLRVTSWLSYHEELFYCDWCNWKVNPEGLQVSGSIDIEVFSDNGYPSMATSIKNNRLVFTWLNDLLVFPEWSNGKAPNPWVDEAFKVYALSIDKGEVPYYKNTRDCVHVHYSPCASVDEKTLIANIKVYPNPAGNIATIHVDTGAPYTLTITNILGQVVQTFNDQKSQVELNVSNYPAGVYIVHVKTAQASASQKLIVK